jgi:hypothetical protein
MKLLYISDRESLKRWGFAISGDKYCSMPYGPVLSGLYDLINRKNYSNTDEKLQWDMYFKIKVYDLISKDKDMDYDELSEAEIEILDEIDKKYHNKDWEYLVKVVHKFPEYDSRAEEDYTSKEIKKEDILRAVGKSDEEIANIIETEESFDCYEKTLKEKEIFQ